MNRFDKQAWYRRRKPGKRARTDWRDHLLLVVFFVLVVVLGFIFR